MVEQGPFKPLVVGSSPSASTRRVGRVVMRWIANPLLVGSIPTLASKKDLTLTNKFCILKKMEKI